MFLQMLVIRGLQSQTRASWGRNSAARIEPKGG